MGRCPALLWLASLAAAVASAQAPPASPPTPPPKPLPAYTAEQLTTSTSVNADGTPAEFRETVLVARDAQGRYRRDIDPANQSPPRSVHMIFISDPVAKIDYAIRTDQRTIIERTWQPAPVAPPPVSSISASGVRTTVEALGTRTIQGFTAAGTRSTVFYPASANEPVHTSSMEVWHCPALGADLIQILRNSLNSEFSTTELVNIQLGDPPAGLFAVPADYAVTKLPPPGGDPAVTKLFQQAKAGLAGIPSLAAPTYLVYIGEQEQFNLDPATAAAAPSDLRAAFRQALELSPTGLGSRQRAQLSDINGQLELHVVESIANDNDAAGALALTRQAEAPAQWHERMYDAVLFSATRNSWQAKNPSIDLIAVARECQEATGLYPFYGLVNMLQSHDLPPALRLDLIRFGYEAAANAAMPLDYFASYLLAQGHQQEPNLDAELETALLAILRRPPAAGLSPNLRQQADRTNGSLLALLRQLDPDRAAELAPQIPAAAANASLGPPPLPAQSSPKLQQILSAPDQALADAAKIQNAAERFDALVQIANLLTNRKRETDRATAAALAAYALVDDTLLRTHFEQGCNLAQSLEELHLQSQAASLYPRILDSADSKAAEREHHPPNGSDTDWALGLTDLQDYAYAYAAAARVMPDVALAHAQALQDPYFRPLALAAVAGTLR